MFVAFERHLSAGDAPPHWLQYHDEGLEVAVKESQQF
jgi:hypothetical protein